jgi:hypothetical protein
MPDARLDEVTAALRAQSLEDRVPGYGRPPFDSGPWTALLDHEPGRDCPNAPAECLICQPKKRCDPALPSAESPVPHRYHPDGDDYGSLADGGSYRRLRCAECHRIAYEPLPD